MKGVKNQKILAISLIFDFNNVSVGNEMNVHEVIYVYEILVEIVVELNSVGLVF